MTTTEESFVEVTDRLQETHAMIQAFADLLGNIDAVTDYINGTTDSIHRREALRNLLTLLTDRAKADTQRLLNTAPVGMAADDARQLRTVGT